MTAMIFSSCKTSSKNPMLFQETYLNGQYTIYFIDNNDGTCTIYDCKGELPETFHVPDYTSTGLIISSLYIGCFSGNCNDVIDVIIPDTIKDIDAHAFGLGRNIKTIALGKNVESISSLAFGDSGDLEIISCDNNPKYVDIDKKCLMDVKSQELVLGTISGFIPSYTCKIGDYAFSNISFIDDITIPVSVTAIGEFSFTFCVNLGDIILPDTIKSIGKGAFSYSDVRSVRGGIYQVLNSETFEHCENLTSVVLPQCLCAIQRNAFFANKQLANLHIPSNVSNIEEYAVVSSNTQVCCEVSTQPIGWAEKWNGENTTVVWGCSEYDHDLE